MRLPKLFRLSNSHTHRLPKIFRLSNTHTHTHTYLRSTKNEVFHKGFLQ